MTRRTAIVGVGLADVGQGPASPYDLIASAAQRALNEAGLSPHQVDGLASTGLGMMPPVEVAEYLGLRPRWMDSTSFGGASWEAMVAKSDLRQGLRTANLDWGSRGALQWEVPYGHTLIGKYAMAARRHMHEYGTTIEQLAEVAVSARANAKDNPQAAYRDPISVSDVVSGRMIADPFTKLHCCIRSDGAAAWCSSPRTASRT